MALRAQHTAATALTSGSRFAGAGAGGGGGSNTSFTSGRAALRRFRIVLRHQNSRAGSLVQCVHALPNGINLLRREADRLLLQRRLADGRALLRDLRQALEPGLLQPRRLRARLLACGSACADVATAGGLALLVVHSNTGLEHQRWDGGQLFAPRPCGTRSATSRSARPGSARGPASAAAPGVSAARRNPPTAACPSGSS